MKNLGDAVERFLNHRTKLTQQAKDRSVRQIRKHAGCPVPIRKNRDPSARKMTAAEELRKERSSRVRALFNQGTGIRAIGKQLGLSRKTVGKYVYGDQPYLSKKRKRSSKIESYRTFLWDQWNKGCHNAAQLWRELQQKGYQGSQGSVRHYLASWRQKEFITQKMPEPQRLSPRRISRLLTQPDKETQENELIFLKHLFDLSPSVKAVAKLGRQFLALLRERRRDLFAQWLKQVDQSGIEEIKRFAKGLKQDRRAVEAAMSSQWSNGQTEGQVNRLKLIKRQLYGRASFELLKKRILLTK